MKGKIKYFEDNKQLLKTVLIIALPIMVQNGFTNFVNLLDNIMVGRLGTEQMSGVAIVNQVIFVFNLCIFGGLSGAGIFTAQYFGKNDSEGVRNTFRFKFSLALFLSALAILVFSIFGSSLVSLYLSDSADGGDLAATLKYGEDYLSIMLIGLPVFALVQTYSSTLRECGQTVVPMKAGVAAVLVNLLFNYLLIFGNFGFPALGVRGAAYATVLSRFVELAVVIIWTHTHTSEVPFASSLYRTLRVPSHLVSGIMKKGMILLINEAMWSLGLSLVNQCFSTRGLNAVAGVNIASTLDNFFKVVFLAFGNSVGIIVGRLLGAGKMEEARETDTKIITFSVIFSSFVGLVMLSLSHLFPQIYNTTDAARSIATSLIIVQAVCMPLEAFKNATYFTLRSGGRTFITFLFDGFSTMAVNFPIAFILSRFTDASVLWIFISVQIGGLVKAVVGFILVKKGVWLRNIVTE
ncbi:MAG: MATE family efflux transporter [Sphaerochaetaceae bacterium]|nr:MATE family efflux transporter [Sphaerochaetaceae bacterium]